MVKQMKKNKKSEFEGRPTSELHVDYSQLSEEDQKENKVEVPWKWLLFVGIIATLMIACIIVIVVLNNR